MNLYDVIIIGSGPAGLSAAIYAKRACLNAVVCEKEYMGTGQIAESSRVDNYPGMFGENGYDLGEKFRSHAEALGAEFFEGEAESIIPDENGYTVKFADGQTLSGRNGSLCCGNIPPQAEYKGRA